MALALAALAPGAASAQRFTRPERPWITIRTPNFRFHAPRELEPWTRSVAERMESIREAERRVVGHVPGRVTDVVVDDPFNDANGSAYPFLDGPTIFLWPVPPSPRSFIGNARSWGEILAVHEFAHIAHLDRPSRNPWQRTWRRLVPGMVGPIASRTPRWAIEGYATYVEGALTGTGRPHAALRAAVLRTWALEGRLPTYAGLNGGGGYLGGSFAYLMGSAYLEWLGAERGDSSITALWRRLSARRNRSFDEAFAGVWGDAPATLYGRFTARVTNAAFAAQARIDSAGRVEGALVQRLARQTGDPAVSRDGRRLAIELAGAPGAPSRIVVWRAGADAARDTVADSAFARDRRRLLRRDPEDVPAVRAYPLPRRAVATLPAIAGRVHHDPRWLADGRRVLVWRDEPTPDGVLRPDLFLWEPERGTVRRVTAGATVREADPAPDGRRAAAVRCDEGRCDLVLVELATGAVRTIRRGTFGETWTRPRWSPDGVRLVAGLQRGGRWRVVIVDPRGGPEGDTDFTPNDGAERYDASFTPDGRAITYVSEAGGIPNVVRRELAGAAVEQPLTRVSSAAFAPEPSVADGRVYFLHLTPHGLDLRRVRPDSTPVLGGTVAIVTPPTLLPRDGPQAVSSAVAQRPPVAGPVYSTDSSLRARPYHAGPRRWTILPFSTQAPGGGSFGAQLGSTDPAGRLTWLLQGAAADRRGYEGGSLRAAWRGLPVTLTGETFTIRQDLASHPAAAGGLPADRSILGPARWRGGALIADGSRHVSAGGVRLRGPLAPLGALDARVTARVGVTVGELAFAPEVVPAGVRYSGQRRDLAFGDIGASLGGGRGVSRLALSIGAHGATGRTQGVAWNRGLVLAGLTAGPRRAAVVASGLLGEVSDGTPPWERFAAGGTPLGLADDGLLSQRVAIPALPFAYRTGPRVASGRVALDLGQLVRPYVQAVSAGDRLGAYTRLAGLEVRTDTPFAPFARAPRSRFVLGVAQILDGPLAERTRGYLSVTFQP